MNWLNGKTEIFVYRKVNNVFNKRKHFLFNYCKNNRLCCKMIDCTIYAIFVFLHIVVRQSNDNVRYDRNWSNDNIIGYFSRADILGSSASGIREMFVNQFGYVLSDLSCREDEDYGTPREARPINSEIYKITEAYHGVGNLCDSGRSRRCIRFREVKLHGESPRLLCWGYENSFMCEYEALSAISLAG